MERALPLQVLVFILIALVPASAKPRSSPDDASSSLPLSLYVPVDIKVPSGSGGATDSLRVMVPSKPGERRIADPATLFDHVKGAWDTVVEENQAGLMDAKQQLAKPAPLSARESWHHYQAGQQGVVDSARFLITFGLIPSVQSGGSPLYIAATMGDLKTLARLLDEGVDVDEEKEGDGQTALHAAATMGHEEIAVALLGAGANVDAEAKNGATPLMIASAMGHVGVARALIEHTPHGADVDAAHRYAGTTAMHWAAEMGRVDVVTMLCEKGAQVEAPKVTGGTPLHTASDTNQSAVVRALLSPVCGADHSKLLVGDTVPLYLAAQRGFTEVGLALIEGGADPNFVMPTGKFKKKVMMVDPGTANGAAHYPEKNLEIGNGATVLHASVENGHLEFTRMLLRNGAVQSGSMEGATPLIIALQYRHPHIAKLLIEEGGDCKINARVPKDGSSALFVAAGSGYLEIVALLAKVGATLDIKNRGGATPLSHAVMRGRLDAAQLLIAAGASATTPMANGETVLHLAAQNGNQRATTLLLQQPGVEVDVRTDDGVTPLHRAASSGGHRLVRILLDADAEVDPRVTSTGVTPLMMAAKAGSVNAVRMLLDAGANVAAAGNAKLYSATALYLACQNTHVNVARVLLDAGADVNARLRSIHVTPLFIAAERGSVPLVTELLKRGAAVGARNWNSLTPLAMGALQNRAEVARLLLDHGAMVDPRDNDGTTPLLAAVAMKSGKPKTIQLLLNAGANIASLDKNGTGVVLAAVASRRPTEAILKLVRFLIKAGAAVDEKREVDGATPLRHAVQANAPRLAALLLKLGADVAQPWDTRSKTMLCASVGAGHLKMAKVLLAAGADSAALCSARGADDTVQSRAVARRDFDLIALVSGAEAAAAARAEAAAAKAAAGPTPEEKTAQQFALFDADGDGKLSRIEMVKGLKKELGHVVTEGARHTKFEALFQKLDADSSRSIERSEFASILRKEEL